ncbi:hypothetical protein N7516_009667 [Penicillium verrucosum]|uniref:uncharacterized protein n=1 Tax=Penicillium verrucosum TaxID=60171 RepID=UPI0025455F1C|nr:uncharacterized protein N7516_009667 [Penicillium verrucosum]KAJ5921964.1 hypothetical protein N7516_009667 [Penicillium verrucosum]
MDDNKIDDHDLILQNLAGRLRFEGANCFAKTVKPRGFRETWTGRKLTWSPGTKIQMEYTNQNR